MVVPFNLSVLRGFLSTAIVYGSSEPVSLGNILAKNVPCIGNEEQALGPDSPHLHPGSDLCT